MWTCAPRVRAHTIRTLDNASGAIGARRRPAGTAVLRATGHVRSSRRRNCSAGIAVTPIPVPRVLAPAIRARGNVNGVIGGTAISRPVRTAARLAAIARPDRAARRVLMTGGVLTVLKAIIAKRRSELAVTAQHMKPIRHAPRFPLTVFLKMIASLAARPAITANLWLAIAQKGSPLTAVPACLIVAARIRRTAAAADPMKHV